MAADPEASVVITTRDHGDTLARCLAALGRQTQDPETFEVVVVDDGSTDHTPDLLASLATPFRLRTLRRAGDGPVAARKAGATAAAGGVCILLDDAAIPAPELVGEHLAAHRRAPASLGIGSLTHVPVAGWYEREFAVDQGRRYESRERGPARWTDGSDGNLSVSREVLISVVAGLPVTAASAPGGTELTCRLWRHGLVPIYIPRALARLDDGKRRSRILEEIQQRGGCDAEFAQREPRAVPGVFGWFGSTTDREIVLRRLLVALRVPPVLLASLGALLPGSERRQIWFDLVSRYGFWLGVRRAVSRRRWARLTRGIPVLMYHAFQPLGDTERFIISRRRFALQMRILAVLRYRVISVDTLAELLRENELPPPRAVAITIDDGYLDNLEIAEPILTRRGFRSTLFLVSRRLGGVNDWDPEGEVAGRSLLSREDVIRLRDRGVEIGAHTRTHPTLPDLADASLLAEIAGSREDLERTLGGVVTTFTYPYGRHDSRAVAAASAAGYAAALTTEPRLVRPGDDPMRIPRIEIRGTDSALRFARKLLFGGA